MRTLDLQQWASWTCPGCGTAQRAPSQPRELRCDGCCAPRIADRAEALVRAGVGRADAATHFETRKLPGGRWPRHMRGGERAAIDPPAWRGHPAFVFAWGPPGAGKTCALVELLWLAYQRGESIRYAAAGVAAEEIRTSAAAARELREAGVVLLDDLNTQLATWQVGELGQRVIQPRFGQGRPLLVTSTVPPEKMYAIYPSVLDRLAVGGLVLHFDRPSLRMEAAS
ncbi:MAG: hypothetical protein AAGC60_00110 [Acidobacteriota bacterium]